MIGGKAPADAADSLGRVCGVIKNDVTFMKELTKYLELNSDTDSGESKKWLRLGDPPVGEPIQDVRGEGRETSLMRAAVARFLEELAPDNRDPSEDECWTIAVWQRGVCRARLNPV